MKFRWSTLVAAALTGACLTVVSGPTAAAPLSATPPTSSAGKPLPRPGSLPENPAHEQLIEFVKQYKLANPHDLVGLDQIVRQYTGQEVKTSINGAPPVSAVEAQEIYDEFLAEKSTSTPKTQAMRAIPTDAFLVTVQAYAAPAGGAVTVLGQWDWRDDFVGQGDPLDIAGIQMDGPDCLELTDHDAASATYTGALGPTPTLRSSGLQDSGAMWNVDAYPSGFVNQADHGVVSVTADMAQCPDQTARIGTAFTYEANRGGSVIGASIGFGFLSISYSGTSDTLQKSTEPIYMNGLVTLEPTTRVFASENSCIEYGHHGLLRSLWSSYRCIWEAAGDDVWRLYTD